MQSQGCYSKCQSCLGFSHPQCEQRQSTSYEQADFGYCGHKKCSLSSASGAQSIVPLCTTSVCFTKDSQGKG